MNPRHIRRWAIPGSIQHVYSRSIAQRLLFMDDSDRAVFLTYLQIALELFDARLLAFSLLGNHFHLVLQLGTIRLGRVMHKVLGPYAQAFNRRHAQHGYVYDGRFQSILVGDEWYVRCLLRYVIRNRLEAGIVTTLESLIADPWTSLGGTVGARDVPFLDVETTLGAFGRRPEEAKVELMAFIGGYPGASDLYASAFESVLSEPEPRIVGSPEFTGAHRALIAATPGIEARPREDVRTLIEDVCRRRGVPVEELLEGRRRATVRAAREEIIDISFRELGLPFREIGRQLGISGWAAAKAYDRIRSN